MNLYCGVQPRYDSKLHIRFGGYLGKSVYLAGNAKPLELQAYEHVLPCCYVLYRDRPMLSRNILRGGEWNQHLHQDGAYYIRTLTIYQLPPSNYQKGFNKAGEERVAEPVSSRSDMKCVHRTLSIVDRYIINVPITVITRWEHVARACPPASNHPRRPPHGRATRPLRGECTSAAGPPQA